MTNELSDTTKSEYQSDLASIFGATLSLWEATLELAKSEKLETLSDCYAGMDGLMREVMRIGTMFEAWSCRHVDFEALGEVWPYFLQDRFGAACLKVKCYTALESFDEADCLYVALSLHLPLRDSPSLVAAVDLRARNPVKDSSFLFLQIRSARRSLVTDEIERFSNGDDPADDDHAQPFYALYGERSDGLAEHIADRDSFAGILRLTETLAPGVLFSEQQFIPTRCRTHPTT